MTKQLSHEELQALAQELNITRPIMPFTFEIASSPFQFCCGLTCCKTGVCIQVARNLTGVAVCDLGLNSRIAC